MSYTASPLPAGLSFNTGTRVISGTPTTAGTTTVTYTVTDDDGDSDTDTFTITVSAAPVTTTAPGVPTSVSLTTVDHDSVRLTWSAGSGDAATSYQVETRQGTSGGWTSRGTQSSGYTLNGLNADTLYQARVRATNSAGSSSYSSPDSTTTDEETTTFPITLTATAGVEEISLSWTDFDPNYPWQQLWSHSGDSNWAVIANQSGHDTTYTHTDLTGGVTYHYRVRASTAGGQNIFSGYSNEVSETPTAATVTAPGVPTSVSLTTIDHDSVRLTWSAGSGDAATSYQVETRQGTSGGYTSRGTQTSPYTLNGLNSDTIYQARVRATNSAGSSSYSSPDSAITAVEPTTTTAPGVPTSIAATTIDHDSISVTWVAPTTGGAVASYSVRYRDNPVTWTTINNIASTSTSRQLDGLTPSTLYNFQVKAVNTAGSSAWVPSTPISAATDDEEDETEAPGVPTSVSISDTSSNSLTLTWSAPTTGGTPTTYSVQYKKDSETSYSSASDTTSPSVISNLDPATLYDVRVRATNSIGSSTYVEVQGTTDEETSTEAPGIPTNISASAIDHNSISVSWTAPTTGGDAEYYKFRYREQGTNSWTTVSDDLDATSHSIHTLSTLTTYQFQIRASNGIGNSSWAPSTPVTATTTAVVSEDLVPSEPQRVQGDSRSTGVLLTWFAPEETGSGGAITGYNIWRHDGSSWRQIETNTTSTSTTYTDSDTLDIGSNYSYSIRAINSSGAGKYSPSISVLINPSFPSAPIRFQADAQSTGVVMAWLAPADNGLGGAVNGYNIWRSNGTVWMEVESDTGSTSTTYTDTSTLTVGNYYNFAIRAKNSAGNGEWSEVIPVLINPDLPSAPRRVVVTDSGSSIELSWLAPADTGQGGAITGYNIWRNDGNSWSEIEADTGSTTTSYTDSSSRTANVTYAYSLRAINSAGRGEWSEPASWTDIEVDAVEQILPSAPRRLQADAQSTGVFMTWLAPAISGTAGSISGYNIWRSDGTTWSEIVDDTGNTDTDYTDTDTLTHGATYGYVLRAINPAGDGEWSETSSVLINPDLPSAPRRLTVDAQSSGVVMSWLAPADDGTGGLVTGYNIWRWYAGQWEEIEPDTNSTSTAYIDTDDPHHRRPLPIRGTSD